MENPRSLHRSRTSIARALLVSVVLGPLASLVGQAAPVTIVDFSGPSALSAGSQGTFQLDLLLSGVGTSTTTVTSIPDPTGQFIAARITIVESVGLPSFTFDSGEGETLVAAISAAVNGPRSLLATFTFEDPGIDIVRVSGSVQTTDVRTTTEFIPRFDANGSITGFDQVTRQDTAIRIDAVANQLQVAVAAAIPEPGSLLLLCAGLLGLVICRRLRPRPAHLESLVRPRKRIGL